MRLIAILSFIFISTSIISCKKDYTCLCTYTVVDQNNATTTSEESFTITDTKKKAKVKCDEEDGSAALTGYTTTVDCEIE